MLDATHQVAQAAEAKAQVLVPAPAQAQLPEETAWSMIYAEGGVLAVLLAIGITALWKVVARVLEESRQQNAKLIEKQSESIQALAGSVGRVETAIQISDNNNQHALRHLGDVVQGAIQRLDRHEEKLGNHSERLLEAHHRLAAIEKTTGSFQALRPRGSGSKDQ